MIPVSVFLDQGMSELWATHLDAEHPFVGVSVDLQALTVGGTDRDDSLAAFASQYLARGERVRFARYSNRKRREEWLGGRIAVKTAVMRLLPELSVSPNDWQSIAIDNDADGRPFVCQDEIIHGRKLPQISISHSGKTACGLAAGQPCGIDVQQVSAAILRVRERFSSVGERRIALRMDADGRMSEEHGLTMLWAAKEALRKSAVETPIPGFSQMTLVDISDVHRREPFVFVFEINDGGKSRVQNVAVVLLEGKMPCAVTIGGGVTA